MSDPHDLPARGRVAEAGVKVQTIHSAKGLQYRAVVLLWADLLGGGNGKDAERMDAERRLLYVGLTRAEDLLAVLWSGRGSPLTAQLAANVHHVDGPGVPVGH